MLVVGATSCACRLINCFSRLAKFGASGSAKAVPVVLEGYEKVTRDLK